jgi:alcohol dehydrogenase YqhD (iron-dependent ADH family)
MENFIAYNPTHVHFGEGVVEKMNQFISQYGKKVLLMYGKGSVLKNGSYHDTKAQLEKLNAQIVEYNGIKPNPLADHVDEAARLGIENDIDMIVAVGGGSVIDSAKITAICIDRKVPAWDVMKQKVLIRSAKPVIAILTLAATGTEMNAVAVLQNPETKEKIGYRHPVIFPKHSFLDPNYTRSVPANYTAYGIVDLVAHSMEAYFGEGEASLSDRFVYAIIEEAMEYGPALMKDLENYDLRARIMWAATNALNGLTSYGRVNGDWGVHAIGHTLSFLYDTAHGASLSIAYPAWLRHLSKTIPDRITEFGKALFGTTDPESTIEALETFFHQLGSPIRMQEENIQSENFDEILDLMNKNKAGGMAHALEDDDRKQILEFMFGE